MIRSIVLLSCLMLGACYSNKQVTQDKSVDYEKAVEIIAQEKYGDNYHVQTNSTNAYSLVTNRTKTFKEIGFDINYIIIDHKVNSIIDEGFLKSGHIEWIDEVNLKAVNRMIDENNKRKKEVYTFNAATKERIDL